MKMLKMALIVVITPLLLSNYARHDYYFSVTQVEYVKDKQSLQCITQLFTDDIEKLLQKRYSEDIVLGGEDDEGVTDKYLAKYLSDKIKVKINGEPVEFEFIGKRYEEFSLYCYFEYTGVQEINSFDISNQLLFELFKEQQNLVKTNINNVKRSFNLIPDRYRETLTFK